jgi:hypothetical protein
MGRAQNITFDVAQPVRLIRVGERIFRVSLEAVRDKANASQPMFFEYEFAISEEEPTAENRAVAISRDTLPQPRYPAAVEQILTAMKDLPVGTLELRLPQVANGNPNIARISAGTKSFLFDPTARVVEFRMTTSAGKAVDLHLPLEKTAIPDGSYFIAFVWDNSKGGRLHVNDKFAGDGV